MDNVKKKSSSSVLYFIGGLVAGAAAGVLLAPKSGQETREDLNDLVKNGREKAQAAYDKVRKSIPSRASVADGVESAKQGAKEFAGV